MYDKLYVFLTGPMIWISFSIFIIGSIVRIVRFVTLSREKDSVIYSNFQTGWALQSILRWLLPLNITARTNPVVVLAGFVFHICLLTVALFLSAHVILIEESWNISWPTLSDNLADILTMIFLASAAYFIVRRLTVAHVKILTTPIDWVVMAIAVLPFLTGFMAYHQWFDYKLMLVLHVLFGNIMLIAIPFTKLSHMYMFFVSRAVTGSDFGKRKVGAW